MNETKKKESLGMFSMLSHTFLVGYKNLLLFVAVNKKYLKRNETYYSK